VKIEEGEYINVSLPIGSSTHSGITLSPSVKVSDKIFVVSSSNLTCLPLWIRRLAEDMLPEDIFVQGFKYERVKV